MLNLGDRLFTSGILNVLVIPLFICQIRFSYPTQIYENGANPQLRHDIEDDSLVGMHGSVIMYACMISLTRILIH